MSKGVKQRPRIGKRIKDGSNSNSELYSMLRRLETPNAISTPSFSGVSGGSNSGVTGSTFLPISGGTMIGAIAFFPKLITISSGAIDIGVTTDNFTSRVIITPESGSTDDLVTITGAKHSGQLLIIQGIQTDTITLKTTGNIETIDGSDFALADDDNIIMIFDSTDNKWQQITTGKVGVGDNLGNHTATQNLDMNEKDLEKVNMITFKDDFNNNFISSTTSGVTYNVNSTDHHKFYSGLTALVTIDTADITLGATLDMATNNISSCGNISFHTHSSTSPGQNITTSTAGLLYQATNPDTHDFLVSAVSRFEVEQSKISLKEDTELTGGKRLASSSATEIGIFVRNETGTIGTLGTVQLPEYTATTAPTNGTLDTNFGAFQGSSGIFRDTDTTAGSRFYIRGSDGNWYYSFLTQQT